AAILARMDDGERVEGKPGGLLLVGCGYARHAPDVARDALRATARLLGRSVRPVERCCGLPLLYAGDRSGFAAAARAFVADIRAAAPERFVALDPGCARTVRVDYARVGAEVQEPLLFVDLVYRERGRLRPLPRG